LAKFLLAIAFLPDRLKTLEEKGHDGDDQEQPGYGG
jgi:hypothetical protein